MMLLRHVGIGIKEAFSRRIYSVMALVALTFILPPLMAAFSASYLGKPYFDMLFKTDVSYLLFGFLLVSVSAKSLAVYDYYHKGIKRLQYYNTFIGLYALLAAGYCLAVIVYMH